MTTTNKVDLFDLSRLRIGEQIEFLSLVSRLLGKHNLKSLGIDTAWESFKCAVKEVESRFKRSRASTWSIQMKEFDALRDTDIICLRMVTEGMTRYFDPEKRAAAVLLLNTIDRFGTSIYNLNYEEETAVIRNLVRVLRTDPELISAVEKLSFNELVANLEKNNNQFTTVYASRVNELTIKDKVSTLEALKNALSHYRHLVRTLESKAFLIPGEDIQTIIAIINTLVKMQVEKLQIRKGHRRNGSSGEIVEPEN
jgi:hypothetical protein